MQQKDERTQQTGMAKEQDPQKQEIAANKDIHSDRLVPQDGPLKNNDHDIEGDAEQSKTHRNGGQA